MVLEDYLSMRRTSRRGPTAPLRERLDRWGIDLFFADSFPEGWYVDRQSGFHLRRLPEWIPIFAARSHAIYLRHNARNRGNLERVAAHYARLGVPFDRQRGLDVSRMIREAPDFAAAQQLVLPDRARLARLAAAGSPGDRARAMERLAEHAWRVGDFAGQLEYDRALLALRPRDRDAAFRLGDALLALGRAGEALPVLERLGEARPRDDEVARLTAMARHAVRGPDALD